LRTCNPMPGLMRCAFRSFRVINCNACEAVRGLKPAAIVAVTGASLPAGGRIAPPPGSFVVRNPTSFQNAVCRVSDASCQAADLAPPCPDPQTRFRCGPPR
jgi:hypothetical protein